MDKVIIHPQYDDAGNEVGVAIVIPSPNCGMTVEQIAAKDVPAGVPYSIVSRSIFPADRMFRNAWMKSGNGIAHDMPKAKVISHDKRRAARAAEFAPLDIEATIPSMAAQAEAKRQAIRDKYAVMQTQIDAATTIDQLRAIVSGL